ncbi:MAG TPA: ATP synthase F1 subunit delta [Myxococcales bacterium]|nr:ATP synthase F1 subunit delta [Myxococcales bacterium]
MIDARAARRYARALLELGTQDGKHEQYGHELDAVMQALKESREARWVLENPGYTAQQRHAAVEALSITLQLSPTVVSFLRLLVDRQRTPALADIVRAYRAMLDKEQGRVRATVTSAHELTDDELARVREAIARMTGRNIVLETKVDPSLIGGVVTQVGATMLDGSLRTQLEKMREQLKNAS